MIKTYLKTAFRVIKRNRTYSLINIVGLTIGLWACMIVATIVIDDLSYDRQWSKGKDIYRILTLTRMGEGLYDRMGTSFAGLAPELKKNFPELENYSSFSNRSLQLKLNGLDDAGVQVQILNADTSFWSILDMKVLSGTPRQYVAGSTNLVISESFRNKYFANENPVGKILYDLPSYDEKANPYLITGVVKDMPQNSHLRAEVIIVSKPRTEELRKEQYGTFNQNYVVMRPGTNMKSFTEKANQWYKNFIGKSERLLQYEFQPMKDIYLKSDFAKYQNVKGSIQNIYIFSGVAVLLLLIACVNFINISTARAATRLKETGVHKILGASRKKIIYQFLTEALLYFALSTLLALLLYQFSLRPVEAYLEHTLVHTFLSRISLFVLGITAILLISLLTGIYPAWLMSGFKPVNTLKGNLISGTVNGQNWLRKSLVVLQFSISIVVLLAMIVVQRQLNYMKTTDIGYNKNNLLSIQSVSWDGKGTAFKTELLKLPGVKNATMTTWLPSNGGGYMSREIDDPSKPGSKINVWYILGDLDFATTIGLRLNQGRVLSNEFSTDAIDLDSLREKDEKKYGELSEVQPSMMTASTAKILHVNKLNEAVTSVKSVPVGIVQDFHTQSFKDVLGATIITAVSSPQYSGMLIRVNPGQEKQVGFALQKLWKQFYPAKLLDTQWVDDLVANQYRSEFKLQQLFAFFSTLTMILAALGIFGLIVHAAQQRVKEIGVRKVLGASVASIVRLLSSDFLRLVIIAIIVASPVAWFFMNKWLENFAYKVEISWWMFAIAGVIAITIAFATISSKAIRAALANPAESLRAE